jgi:hypothetical protein
MRSLATPFLVVAVAVTVAVPAALAFAAGTGCNAVDARSALQASPPRIIGHPVRVDARGHLLSWSTSDAPYAEIARLSFHALESDFQPTDSPLPVWLGYSRFDPDTFEGIAWPHNPAGLYAMLVDSAILWFQFSGDHGAIDLARTAIDYQLAHGTTPGDWAWASVPYASAGAGDADYRGADDQWCDFCGRGDGIGVIEPDKVGELGFAYLQMFETTGEDRYRDAAIACADALAEHVRAGDETHSPWPFRVYAETNVIREEYSSNVIGAVNLFDELDRLALGSTDDYSRARGMAFDWLMRVPMTNDAWSGYFEDIDIYVDPFRNPNQYSALRTARWLMAHRGADPEWRKHVAHLLAWAERTFAVDTDKERGRQWGAAVISEQGSDMAKMASHTARFGATTALWSEATGDDIARERASRSLNWATYACREDGIVAVGEDANEGYWFSDGYADYIRHFLIAMAAVPDWAPAREDHVVRSTSVMTRVAYQPGRVDWTTFDADSVDTLRLAAPPLAVLVNGAAIALRTALAADAYTVRPLPSGGVVVRVHHSAGAHVSVQTQGSRPPPYFLPRAPLALPAAAAGARPSNGRLSRATWAGAVGLATVFAIAAAMRERSRRRVRELLFPGPREPVPPRD